MLIARDIFYILKDEGHVHPPILTYSFFYSQILEHPTHLSINDH